MKDGIVHFEFCGEKRSLNLIGRLAVILSLLLSDSMTAKVRYFLFSQLIIFKKSFVNMIYGNKAI